ncbi:hypothetical protein BBP40_000571 [Aspergillus hancockii]|nr:hypothetical protein BBP40_000571 [Aspergillus hancockii]
MASPSHTLEKGQYIPAAPGDLRAPCPVLNTLANHGLISRDGRNITAEQLKNALKYIGVGIDIRTVLVRNAFKIHEETSHRGLREPNQMNESGVPVLDLDQTARPHATEHDVSLSREDRAVGDCVKPDPELIEKLLTYPRNKDSFSISDLGRFRKKRIAEQKEKNPNLKFDSKGNKTGCGEAALLLCVFGKGIFYKLPVTYLKAVFNDERLPYDEGWKPRWAPVMFAELAILFLAILYYSSPI